MRALNGKRQNPLSVAVRIPTVALVGNPNTGKTTLFNALAGMNQRVGNYPGVTVETKKGKLRIGQLSLDIIDLPGTYSLAPRSPDEMVAVDFDPSATTRASHGPMSSSRLSMHPIWSCNLYLMTQVLELKARGHHRALQHDHDVAEGQGLNIDVDKLSPLAGRADRAGAGQQGQGLDRACRRSRKSSISRSVPRGLRFRQPSSAVAGSFVAQRKLGAAHLDPPPIARCRRPRGETAHAKIWPALGR